MPKRTAEAGHSRRGHGKRAPVLNALEPIAVEGMAEDRGSDRTGQMRPALAPVETRSAEHPALASEAKVDADRIEEGPAGIVETGGYLSG